MAIEEPEYRVIEQFDEFELRHYDEYIVAEVDVPGDFIDGGNDAFRILAGYIFGDNTAEEKMSMTAPVTTTAGDAGLTTYAFVIERKYTLETLPAPIDPRIRLYSKPERVMAVRQYSGRWTEEKYQKNLRELREALAAKEMQTSGEPILARYNSPFSIPLLRRNEVMMVIQQ